jgi:branched-chain amino acid transport system ATP-binding protein
MSMLLEVNNLKAGYGAKQVVHDVSLSIAPGEIVGLIGHNGAGKSTTFQAIYGLLKPWAGNVLYLGRDMTNTSPGKKLDAGIYHVPQEYFIFDDFTVKENMEIAYFTMKDQSGLEASLEEVYGFFPKLAERESQMAGTLSGGERRMLGIGMGLLRRPKLLMLDEPSSGLSPVAFQNVAQIVSQVNRDLGTAVLIIEQNVKVAFELSNRVYVMKAGRITLEESGEEMLKRGEWWDLF